MAHIRKTLIPAVLVAALSASLSACSGSDGSKDADKPQAAVTATQEPSESPLEGEDFGDAESDLMTVGVDETAKWRNGVTARLGNFTRGITGDTSYEPNVRYLAFTITMTNGSDEEVDLGGTSMSCAPGSEEIFYSERGFEGTPSSYLLPGKTVSWSAACEFGQDETEAQVELTPSSGGDGWYRTAVFAGKVK